MQINTEVTMDPAERARLRLPDAINAAEFLVKLANQRGMTEPLFTEVSERGPPHMRTFVWHCTFNDLVSQGIGPSKKEAKLAAAKAIKDALDYENLPPIKPVKPVQGETFKRKNENTFSLGPSDGFGIKREKSMGQDIPGQGFGKGFKKGFESQMQKMPSLLNSYGMGFNNTDRGLQSLGKMDFQTPLFSNGMGFGKNRRNGFGSFQQMQSVNRMPVGHDPIPSLSSLSRVPHGFAPVQEMPFSNHMTLGNLGSMASNGSIRSTGFGRGSCWMGPNSFGGPLPLMGFQMPGLSQRSVNNLALEEKQATMNLFQSEIANPYNPYTFNLNTRKEICEDEKKNESKNLPNSKSAIPTREELMRPSFGSFFSDVAAGPSLKDFPTIEKDRKFLIAEFETRITTNRKAPQSKLDKIVLKKHKDLCPRESELKFILKLVTDTEQSLKKVAIDLNKLDKEPMKAIDGMLRVGDLSKGLLMVGDRAVNLLLMCKHPPTLALLRHIQMLIVEKLKDVSPGNEYQIHGFEEEAGFCVVAMPPDSNTSSKGAEEEAQEEDLPFAVNVSLTSMSLTPLKNSDSDDVQGKTESTTEDPLPKEKCVLALSEMRHSKWFSVTAANMSSCIECIRIVKDISNRDPIWNVVPDWAIEVMVERAAFTAWVPLNLGSLLKRVMEMISSGMLLPNGSGIKDPCEIKDVDVMNDLSPQQKENLTKSAQRFLRLMQFDQIYEVLGIDAPSEIEVSVHEATTSEKA